jgi:hypothetical protein
MDVESQWSEGAVKGWGRIALSGYSNASWTEAEVRFLRSETKVKGRRAGGGAEDEEEERTLETVEEIHLKWKEMTKVGCFKRVRI